MKLCYSPGAGDIVWINFNPTKGREQNKKRPAIVITPKSYNKKTSLALVCPITSRKKDYPFEVLIESKDVEGVILVDQIRSVDWNAREVEFIEICSSAVLSKVKTIIKTLVG